MIKKEVVNVWEQYLNKEVRIMIEDSPFPKPRDGIFINYNTTHIFLKVINKELPVPFLITTIRRIDVNER